MKIKAITLSARAPDSYRLKFPGRGDLLTAPDTRIQKKDDGEEECDLELPTKTDDATTNHAIKFTQLP